jgi:porphobilinogen synthase
MVRENVLTTADLIWPVFVVTGDGRRHAVGSMPGVERLTVDEAVREAERAAKLGIPAIALFPYTDPSLRDPEGSEALNEANLVCCAVRAIKAAVPEIGLVTDVALDPYTSHGHDGLLDGHTILNDETVDVLARQAVVQAQAGADIIAPSDMMDGRVGAIRMALDAAGFTTCRSWPMRRNTRPPSTAPSATRSARTRRSSATSAPTRWTRRTPTRPCARWRSTSRRAPTW